MEGYRVGVIGGTGMVGQRFITLLVNHPWFHLTVIAASSRSAGKSYQEAVEGRWIIDAPLPESAAKLVVLDAVRDAREIAEQVDFIFSALCMDADQIRALEENYARLECPVISNNSAHRWTPDVPMVIPEINPEHLQVIAAQRRRLGIKRGFIAVKSNCSLQSYVPALHPLRERFGLKQILVCTYQAISGAGRTFDTWPEMRDNLIPFISGEEEKSEHEPLKLWGHFTGDRIIPADSPCITAQCIRVPVQDGHLAAVFARFDRKPELAEIRSCWSEYQGIAQKLKLPSAPYHFLHYYDETDRPQISLDRNSEGGMAVSIGRLRADSQYDCKFVCLSHNTLRGAAGGAVLLAELLCAQGYITRR